MEEIRVLSPFNPIVRSRSKDLLERLGDFYFPLTTADQGSLRNT